MARFWGLGPLGGLILLKSGSSDINVSKVSSSANAQTYNFILNSVCQYFRTRGVQLLGSAIDQRDSAT